MAVLCAICGKPIANMSVTWTTESNTDWPTSLSAVVGPQGWCAGHYGSTIFGYFSQGPSAIQPSNEPQIAPVEKNPLYAYLKAFEGEPAFDLPEKKS